MDEKRVGCLWNPSQHVHIYLEYFPSYTMPKWMRKCKNNYFYHVFVSPRDSLVVITLNVIWMERELGWTDTEWPRAVIEHDALCPRQIRIGGCEIRINYEATVFASECALLPWGTTECCSRLTINRWEGASVVDSRRFFMRRIELNSLVKKYHGNMIVKSTMVFSSMVFYTIVLLPW